MFSVPDPSAAHKAADRNRRPQAEQTSSLEFAFEFLRMVVFGLVALVGLYLSFLLVAPIFGHFLSGTLKLAATIILASAIPLLTALGENSKRERFDVVDKPYDRVVRVFVGTAIFSFGTAVLCSLAMSGSVVHDLRRFPNWFMSDAQRASSVGDFNEKVSLGIAQIVEDATTALGIYGGKPSGAPAPVRPVIVKPPAPTRPATRAQQQAEAAARQKAAEAANAPQDSAGAEKPAVNPGPTPKQNPGSGGSDNQEYIRW